MRGPLYWRKVPPFGMITANRECKETRPDYLWDGRLKVRASFHKTPWELDKLKIGTIAARFSLTWD